MEDVALLIGAIAAMSAAIGVVYTDFKKVVKEDNKILISFFEKISDKYETAITNNTAALHKLEIHDALDNKSISDMGDTMKDISKTLVDIHEDHKLNKDQTAKKLDEIKTMLKK